MKTTQTIWNKFSVNWIEQIGTSAFGIPFYLPAMPADRDLFIPDWDLNVNSEFIFLFKTSSSDLLLFLIPQRHALTWRPSGKTITPGYESWTGWETETRSHARTHAHSRTHTKADFLMNRFCWIWIRPLCISVYVFIYLFAERAVWKSQERDPGWSDQPEPGHSETLASVFLSPFLFFFPSSTEIHRFLIIFFACPSDTEWLSC